MRGHIATFSVLVAFAGAYGSTKRYKSVQRLIKVNGSCIVGASGEISDFQRVRDLLEELELEDYLAGDGINFTPRQVHAYLTRIMYNRRSKCESRLPFLATLRTFLTRIAQSRRECAA
jgi:20S proteasome alpha/beta subunit